MAMCDETREVAQAGIQARHPEYGDEDLKWALFRLLLGDALFRAAFQGRPLLAPWAARPAPFCRRIQAQLFDVPVYLATAEDTILSKLEWSRLGGGSERQVQGAQVTTNR